MRAGFEPFGVGTRLLASPIPKRILGSGRPRDEYPLHARLKSGAEPCLEITLPWARRDFRPAFRWSNAERLSLPYRLRQMLYAVFFAVSGHAKL
jgi:hypothetical protein